MPYKSLLAQIALALVPALAVAGDARPRCDAKHLGQFWPESKNGVANVQQLAESGELEVCSHTEDWHYGWNRLKITVDQPKPERKKADSPAAAHP